MAIGTRRQKALQQQQLDVANEKCEIFLGEYKELFR
jgi:hypothetical protein